MLKKVIIYALIFFFAFYVLSYISSGTEYDNVYVLVIGLVSVFFLVDFLGRYLKKNNNEEK
ncbi:MULTISPECIES: hypothetical protein [Bacillus]|uniref:hypothetical protein n=1 Tax=Bacillus TaxID=1386 RepID=UPI000BB98919|nr:MULTISPECIES: hypothetical protein [Bacillus]